MSVKIIGKYSHNPKINLNLQFIENPVFIKFMHHVIMNNILDYPEIAEKVKNSKLRFIHLIDDRASEPGCQIYDEDIYASLELNDDGSIDYVPNEKYKVYGKNGLFQLSPIIMSDVKYHLECMIKE